MIIDELGFVPLSKTRVELLFELISRRYGRGSMRIAPRFGWLVRQERGWGRGPHLPDFRAQHPKNWAQIEAGYDKWRLPGTDAVPQ